jgi:SAM-dependent methyltransferase
MSIERLDEHRRVWCKKPALALIYGEWFDLLLRDIPPAARVLEVGAGPGFLSEYARGHRSDLVYLACDIVKAPWNDLVADAQKLPLRSGCVNAALAVDLIHHLGDPGSFFREIGRVLAPGGWLAVIEPWISPFSYPIYRWFHREGCRSGVDPWRPFPPGVAKEPFEGDSGVFAKLVRETPDARWNDFGFDAPRCEPFASFAYLMSLGFIDRNLAPLSLIKALLALDRRLKRLAPWLGLRARSVWMRRADRR